MDVVLTPELEQLLTERMASGLYRSTTEALDAALRLLKEHEEENARRLEDLRREIAIGLEQANRGELAPVDIEEIIATARRQYERWPRIEITP